MKHIFAFVILLTISKSALADDKEWSRVDSDNLIDPIAASYLGGSGTDWLVGGGFQPDGSLALVGVTIGPKFEIGGSEVTVIGTDQDPPSEQAWPIQLDPKGRPRKNREGTIKLDRFGYRTTSGTPFVVRLTADLQTVQSVVRLPWSAGTVTGAVTDREGGIYVAGFGDAETLKTVCSNVSDWKEADVEFGKSKPQLRTAYLLKVNAVGNGVEWLRTCETHVDFPRLELQRNGTILFKGLSFDTFTPDGKLIERLTTAKGMHPSRHAVNQTNGEFVYGHEHHWPTGREPWRCPELKLFNPDGSVKYHLYDWPGPIVGSDASRLVSDSAVRNIQYMPNGDLLYSAWSDGGNSVMYNHPFDLYQKAWDGKTEGLRLSAAGANAMSFAYVIKLDPESCRVKRGTLWTSRYKGVESARINAMGSTGDGSVAIAGSVYGHLYSTPNMFDAGEQRGGSNLTILNTDLDGLRFSSYTPGCGEVDLGNKSQFQWIQGTVNGRDLLVAVTGAKPHEHSPRLNAVQPKFAGGHLDGHFVVFDVTE